MRKRHLARQVGLTVQQARQGRARHLKRGGGGGDRQASRFNDLRPDEIAGVGQGSPGRQRRSINRMFGTPEAIVVIL